jgi:hypothetical protein
MDIIRIIIAILLPPLGVFLQVGFAGAFWLNITRSTSSSVASNAGSRIRCDL